MWSSCRPPNSPRCAKAGCDWPESHPAPSLCRRIAFRENRAGAPCPRHGCPVRSTGHLLNGTRLFAQCSGRRMSRRRRWLRRRPAHGRSGTPAFPARSALTAQFGSLGSVARFALALTRPVRAGCPASIVPEPYVTRFFPGGVRIIDRWVRILECGFRRVLGGGRGPAPGPECEERFR